MKFSKALEEDIAHKIDCFGAPSEENDFETYSRVNAIHDLMQDMDNIQHYSYEHQSELRKIRYRMWSI